MKTESVLRTILGAPYPIPSTYLAETRRVVRFEAISADRSQQWPQHKQSIRFKEAPALRQMQKKAASVVDTAEKTTVVTLMVDLRQGGSTHIRANANGRLTPDRIHDC